jgi:hypothetical protein
MSLYLALYKQETLWAVSDTRVQKAYNSLEFQEYGGYECLSIYFYKAVEERRQKVITEDALIYLILSSKKNFVTQGQR